MEQLKDEIESKSRNVTARFSLRLQDANACETVIMYVGN